MLTLEHSGTAVAAPSRFTLARAVEWVALGVLLGAIAKALRAFFSWGVAVPVAITLTWCFSQLVHVAMVPGKWYWRTLAGVWALVLACVTTSLSYSSIYAATSAPESARRDYEIKRERTQRELQRLVGAAESARQSISDWSEDAGSKAVAEAKGGMTCPGRDSGGKPGPISTWRGDDSRVAASLAGELQTLVTTAKSATTEVLALSPTDDFDQVKAGYAVLNRAIDAVAPLTKGGWASSALATLGDRRSSQITYPGGVAVSCGDGGRLSLIDHASLELKKLDDTPALPRLSPVIDLSQPQDVVMRGLVRGMNLLVYTLSAGHLGQFKDDTLMAEALKVGAFTRETASFGLSILAELGVVFTAMLRRQAGTAPFALNLPAWVQAHARRHPQPGRAQAAVRAAATLLSNAFYGRPAEADAKAPGSKVDVSESSMFGPVTLAEDPTFRERETRVARELLLPWYHSWGDDEDYLVMPHLPETRAARAAARSLAAHELVRCLSTKARWRNLCNSDPIAQEVRAQLGPVCEKLRYEVWTVRGDYAQIMRLGLFEPALQQPSPGTTP